MTQISELRRALTEEMTRLEPPSGLESRVLERALRAQPTDEVGRQVGPSSRIADRVEESWFETHRRSPRAMFFIAALLAIAIVVTLVFTARALNLTRTTPVTYPSSELRSCTQGNLHMVSATVGWNGTSRTTDGGATWRDVSPPTLLNQTKGGHAICVLDAEHAWATEVVGSSDTQTGQLFVLATRDGGQTWQQGAPVPIGGSAPAVQLQFVDDRHGWLLTHWDTSSSPSKYAVYSTTDGGLHWNGVFAEASFAVLGGNDCWLSGMTFVSLSTGWLTWDCTRQFFLDPMMGPLAATTHDGGRSWQRFALDLTSNLPRLPSGNSWDCGANPPVFTGSRGVIPLDCKDFSHANHAFGPPGSGSSRVFRTTDGGSTWSQALLPLDVDLSQIDFVDANIGFAFAHQASGNDLYATRDAGRNWVIVKRGLFSGQSVNSYQFLDETTGFAYTDTSPGVPWKTTDGGRTWSLPTKYRSLPGNIACDAPSNPGLPVPVKMDSPTTGWAAGALRTTDGGAHWSNVGPPSVPNRSTGHAEFFVDANHAWFAETAGSSTACADHIVVFSTANGGQRWQQAAPIPVVIPSPTDLIYGYGVGPWLSFVDDLNGWLLVQTGNFDQARTGPLYRTTDGGLHWTMVTAKPAWTQYPTQVAGPQIYFTSQTTGWMPLGSGCQSADCSLTFLVTHDGGITWAPQVLLPYCGCGGDLPTFIDAQHGLILLQGRHGPLPMQLLVTADGGSTWTAKHLPSDQVNENVRALDFIDPNQGWVIVDNYSTKQDVLRIERTSDGGDSWTDLHSTLPPYVVNLTFVNASDGLLATDSGLFTTTDGGHTWSQVRATIS